MRITHLGAVASTSDLARLAARDGAPEGAAFRADMQTAGRGRHGREWVSGAGNLYLSVVLRPKRAAAEWPGLALMAGLALYRALAGMRAHGRLSLKWPNDVLLDGRKVAGLLLEAQEDAVILGCGVNCLHAPDIASGWPPGWLNQHPDDTPITADQVMERLAICLVQGYSDWIEGGLTAMLDEWKAAAVHIGQRVVIRLGDGATPREATTRETLLCGIFEDVGADGSMLLRLNDGQLKPMTAGDVIQARPIGKTHAAGD